MEPLAANVYFAREALDRYAAIAVARLQDRGLVDGEAITDAGRVAREAIEAATDRGDQAVPAALGDDLDELPALTRPWATAVVDAKGYPVDPSSLASIAGRRPRGERPPPRRYGAAAMASLDHVTWYRRQPLRNPLLIAAFEGWNDAGDAATTATRHLREVWELDLVAELDPEEFYSFTDTRPLVTFDDGGLRRIEWPANRFWAGELPGQERDVLVLEGIEPNLRWRTFGEQVTSVANELGAGMVVTLGALLTDIPHTRPTSVIGTTDDAELVTRLDLRPSGYEGPTGIVGVLHESCRVAGLDSISLWGSVPSYVPGSTSPKAALALVERLGQLLDTAIPVTALEIATTEYERQLDELVQEDEESSTYVAELERVFDEQALHGDGSDLVDEVERFLRDR